MTNPNDQSATPTPGADIPVAPVIGDGDQPPECTPASPPPPTPPTPPTPGEPIFDERAIPSTLCVTCEYDLGGLALGGVCPECGSAIANSFGGYFLPQRSPVYLREVRRGAIALAILMPFVCGSKMVLMFGSSAATNLVYDLLRIIVCIGLAWATRALTHTDTGLPARLDAATSRSRARSVSVVLTALSGIIVLRNVPSLVRLGGGAWIGRDVLDFTVFAVFWILLTVFVIEVAVYCRWLGRRMPSKGLAEYAKQCAWLGPLLVSAGCVPCFLCIAPDVVGGILMAVLLGTAAWKIGPMLRAVAERAEANLTSRENLSGAAQSENEQRESSVSSRASGVETQTP